MRGGRKSKTNNRERRWPAGEPANKGPVCRSRNDLKEGQRKGEGGGGSCSGIVGLSRRGLFQLRRVRERCTPISPSVGDPTEANHVARGREIAAAAGRCRGSQGDDVANNSCKGKERRGGGRLPPTLLGVLAQIGAGREGKQSAVTGLLTWPRDEGTR